ncbi:MAG: hypothetical protein ABSB89_08545 [Candidatus Bathyarchaeia archaeon]|jgi:hypothetical protein
MNGKGEYIIGNKCGRLIGSDAQRFNYLCEKYENIVVLCAESVIKEHPNPDPDTQKELQEFFKLWHKANGITVKV